MKKVLAIALALSALGVVLTGCNKADDTAAAPAATAGAAAPAATAGAAAPAATAGTTGN